MRCIAGFPFEHPLEVAKIKNQGLPFNTASQVIKCIYLQRGFKGFYDGALPNLGKRCFKESYRWPAVALFHSFWDYILPEKAKLEGAGTKLATAGCIAGIETFIVLPLERLVVSKVNEEGYINFFKRQFSKEGIPSLYHGVTAAFFRHLIVWSTFMITNHYVKREFKRLDPNQQHPIFGLIIANLVIAANLTILGLPMDFIKTQVQMNKELQKMRIHQVMMTLLKKNGIRGFYAGAIFTFLHTNIHALLAGTLLDRITSTEKSSHVSSKD